MAFTFTIPNIAQALRSIDTYSKEMQQDVDDEMSKTAYEIVNEAQNLAPVDDGNLRANIRVVKDEPFSKQIESGAEYSVYVEAGTGTRVDIPELTSEFGGITTINNLYDYFIQFKIQEEPYKVNLPARPFFFPAIQSVTLHLAQRLKDILEGK